MPADFCDTAQVSLSGDLVRGAILQTGIWAATVFWVSLRRASTGAEKGAYFRLIAGHPAFLPGVSFRCFLNTSEEPLYPNRDPLTPRSDCSRSTAFPSTFPHWPYT